MNIEAAKKARHSFFAVYRYRCAGMKVASDLVEAKQAVTTTEAACASIQHLLCAVNNSYEKDALERRLQQLRGKLDELKNHLLAIRSDARG